MIIKYHKFILILLILLCLILQACSVQESPRFSDFTELVRAYGESCPSLHPAENTQEPAPDPAVHSEPDIVEKQLSEMTLEEKIAQLFIVSPEMISGNQDSTAIGIATKEGLSKYPVGGIIYFGNNLVDSMQTKQLLSDTRAVFEAQHSLHPFLAVDEEGGRVARIGGNHLFDVPIIGPMADIQTADDAFLAGDTIGQYLHELGFNLDFAPVADVRSDSGNQVIGDRSFGSSADHVGELACSLAQGLRNEGIIPVFKHFPGHGATEADSHQGYAYTNQTYDELTACDMIPFQMASEHSAEMIMAGHISEPSVTGNDLPATLSYDLLTCVLREKIGFCGIIITDSMSMGAITNAYTPAQAAVMAIQAGADIILLPADFEAAYQGVLDAVESGELNEERIDESVRRIIRLKFAYEI